MHLIGLTDLLEQSAAFDDWLAHLRTDRALTLPVIRAARPYLLATLAGGWDGPLLILTGRGKRAHNLAEQLPVWLPETGDRVRSVLRFAEPTPMFYDRLAWDRSVIRERLEVLNALMFTPADAPQPIIVAPARALMQRTLPPRTFRGRTLTLQVGERYAPERLIADWVGLGYEPATMVIEPGTFSRRGGILDIYPMAADLPVRLDFFDDEIDRMKAFNPATQRTRANLRQVTITPAREILPDTLPPVARRLQPYFDGLAEQADEIAFTAVQDADALANAAAFPTMEHYLPYAEPLPVNLLDYASDDTLVVVEDWDDLRETVQGMMQDAEANRANNIKTHQLPDDFPVPYVDWDTLAADLHSKANLHLSSLAQADSGDEADTAPRVFFPGQRYGGQLKGALTALSDAVRGGARAVVVTQQAERLADLWQQNTGQQPPRLSDLETPPSAGGIAFVEGTLGEGWTLVTGSSGTETLHLVTDAELFNWQRPEPRRRRTGRQQHRRLPESDYADWNDGDYVVHVDYGVGQFAGIGQRTVDGNERGYLLVTYAENAMVFVPIDQADRLTRYVGPDEAPPKLNKIGKQEVWERAKQRARKAAEDEARELLNIYAQRAATSGHNYSPDGEWQRELEASFPYVETDDQIRVVKAIKADMESPMPMDRLVTGDVGYGKTEVAVRAAFKAVVDGKQVAVLVPTTVLANQHYETFSRRMANFPIKVEMLSRFRTKAEQSKILNDMANGKIDVLIGTHRILSDDVTLPNLGLIIIDEEQRFGVKQKEHFKKLRAHVDILTLTATPIPRTLYMSLSGVRDISMIQTPPEERLPVITHVGGWDPRIARQAVLRELDRGGQVFVIHNRVKTIETVRERFAQLVPEASIIVGHGQMSGRQLEGVISDFSKGHYDILLATSIIENGIDMPNVNTLIVDRADWFGMSQLYQIRGRVGRSATQAYAYFFHAGTRRLTEEARARLETLAEHTHLGAGFQISMRDLELRGAGDILSTRQTGHVATVGLQLYTQLLQEAVSRMKGDARADLPSVSDERIIIDLPVAAYIPDSWIGEMALRLQLYRRIASLQTVEDVDQMALELEDRFGTLPPSVEGLLFQIRVKLLAVAVRASRIIKPRDTIQIRLPWLTAINRERLANRLGDDINVTRVAVEIPYNLDEWQVRLLVVLEQLKAGMPESARPEAVSE